MLALFRASVADVMAECLAGTLTGRLELAYPHAVGHRAAASEIRSWDQSLPALTRVVSQAGLGDVEMLIEHRLPYSSKRVDVVLCGEHPMTGRPSYVLIELKQWSEAECVPDADDLCIIGAYGRRPVLHPGEQVRRYCRFIADFTTALSHEADALAGAAFLHNATALSVDDLWNHPQDAYGRLFTGDRVAELEAFLQARLAPSSGRSQADLLLGSGTAPSKQLMRLAADEIKASQQFVLLDQQQVAYSLVQRAVMKSARADHKEVVVVTGGPGSGKSVIALALLGDLGRQGRTAIHATGSSSFTTTLRKTAGRGSKAVQQLFQYFNAFTKAEKNGLDVLICDEAHRIRLTSDRRWTRAADRTGRPQIEELIQAARVPVFLLDEHQVVRPGETGTVEVITRAARELGLEVAQVDLDGQYRCGGSRAYEHWVLRLLGLEPGGSVSWGGDEGFEVQVFDSPAELEARLAQASAHGLMARMTAGYCWPWSDPRPDGSLVPDVTIGSWARPWNLRGDRAVGGAPPAALWATDPAGAGQVGCVYTAQGFEYDWNGVIFGPDLVIRDGRWVAQRHGVKDPALRGLDDVALLPLLKNVYKVLLTRGMQGTCLFSVDPETQSLLSSLVARVPARG